MKSKILHINASILLALAAFITGCGPANEADLSLEQSVDNLGVTFTENNCNDGRDNDGNGLRDEEDIFCHPPAGYPQGPLRDLSIAPDPLAVAAGTFSPGHNFYPDVNLIPIGGAGEPGGFRDPAQIADWIAFLTDQNGITAGGIVNPIPGVMEYAGVDSAMVPTPAGSIPHLARGTAAQGNNNNILQPYYDSPVQAEAVTISRVGSLTSKSDSPELNEAPTSEMIKSEMKDRIKHRHNKAHKKGLMSDDIYDAHNIKDIKDLNVGRNIKVGAEALIEYRGGRTMLPNTSDRVYASPFYGSQYVGASLYTNQDPFYPGTGSQGYLGGVNNPN